jgi:Membrane-associated phospholipid phosphatase
LKKYLTFLFLVFISASSFAQKDDASDFFKLGKDLFSVPARFDKSDWTNFSATIGATSACFLFDKQIKEFSQNNKTPFLNGVMQIDRYYHIEAMSAGIVALYGYGLAADKESPRRLALRLTEATVYSTLINFTTKIIIGRSRPLLERGNVEFSPFNIDFNTTSLPSGHTTLAFAYSTVMAAEYNNFLWKFAWYSAATLVGGARIYRNVHWFSDVVLGAAIGYFVGDYVTHHHTNNPVENKKTPEYFAIIVAL